MSKTDSSDSSDVDPVDLVDPAGANPSDLWGIEDRFHDAFGAERITGADTRSAILRAMGIDPLAPTAPDPVDIRVVRPGDGKSLGVAGRLELEDGTVLSVDAERPLPPDLPFGYHTLTPARGHGAGAAAAARAPIRILATPGACFLPADLQVWGWAVQLYAARSRASWGIGDLADLGELGAWTRAQGGGAVMVNPLSAPAPVFPTEPSPYYPSSRRFRSPLFLRIEDIRGASDAGVEIARLGAEGRALNADRRIDRDRVIVLKLRALEILWRRFGGDPDFDAYRKAVCPALDQFAAYSALAERYGKDWRRWPAAFRHPSGAAVSRLIATDERVRFHAWVQWLLDDQLRRASVDVRVIHDLPVGFDVAGADGWCWQDLVAQDISVGCPPDQFNLDGQDWGLAPFIPAKLRAAGYGPFIETLRAMLRHAGGLRIDHVMGLFRLFWIPRRLGARGGTYVRYPADELLAITAIESHRARAIIVGEDLGTVLPGTREILAAHHLLSYRLLFFEPGSPTSFPELALSSVTTHDLATVAGIWTGLAIEHMRSAGLTPNSNGLGALKQRLAALTGLPPEAPLGEVIVGTYGALGRAPSRILIATLEDALEVVEQPNMPGTTTAWPNWSLALPRTVEEIREADLPRRIGAGLRRTNPHAPQKMQEVAVPEAQREP
jgi:4-alpha-glucanotransferase